MATRRKPKHYRCGIFRGEEHPRARLTWAIVGVMRQARADGHSAADLAALFNLSRSTVRSAETRPSV